MYRLYTPITPSSRTYLAHHGLESDFIIIIIIITPITYVSLGVAGYNTLGCFVQQTHGLDCDVCLLCLITEQVCVGLEEAIQTMKLSEVAEVIVQPQYGFGSDPHQAPQATVPPSSTLCYTVELVELHKVSFAQAHA